MKYYKIENEKVVLTKEGESALNTLGITLDELKEYPDEKLSPEFWSECSTYIDQVLKNGHGCSWLDECKIPYKNDKDREINIKKFAKKYSDKKAGTTIFTGMDGGNGRKMREKRFLVESQKGRFPANVLCEDDVLNDGNTRKSGKGIKNSIRNEYSSNTFKIDRNYSAPSNGGDEGSFSRYFSLDAWFADRIKLLPLEAQKTFPFLLVPKASKTEKYLNSDIVPEPSKRPSGIAYNEHSSIHSERKGILHPTMKPLKLMMWLIILGTQEGEIVLDPFMGSGTTLLAAKMTHRYYKGIELGKEFFDTAVKRLDEAQKSLNSFL